MQPTIVFLVVLMAQGWGVSVVVEELSARLRKKGIRAVVGCTYKEGDFEDLDVEIISPDARSLNHFLRSQKASAVVAHSSPYFELLPTVPHDIMRVVWEHGDPTPEFFPDEIEARYGIIENKRQKVYPSVDAVIASSNFLRSDIDFPDAVVINLAGDHIKSGDPKPLSYFTERKQLKVGTLMRLGSGESKYKGNELYRALNSQVKKFGIDCIFEVMGRGQTEDALIFEAEGIRTHLNADNAAREKYLKDLDIFISCSQWEGFNLPVVEAQELGTVGLAFDAGAHPEVTPFLLSSVGEAAALIRAYAGNRKLLHEHSLRSYSFVHNRFSWDRSADELIKVISEAGFLTRTATESKSDHSKPDSLPGDRGQPRSFA